MTAERRTTPTNTAKSSSLSTAALAVRSTRVLEWVRCGEDPGIDGLVHAQRIRAAGVLFVRVRDALRWAMTAVPAKATAILTLEPSEPARLVTQGASSAKLPSVLHAMRGARARRAEDSDVSLSQFVLAVAAVAGETWEGTSGVGAPAQGAVGPLSLRTLVGAARGVANDGASQ